MANIVEVPFKKGSILFAAADAHGTQAFSSTDLAVKAQETFEQIVDRVKDMADVLNDKLNSLNFSEATVSFSISFTGTGKFIIAETSANAALNITLKLAGDKTSG